MSGNNMRRGTKWFPSPLFFWRTHGSGPCNSRTDEVFMGFTLINILTFSFFVCLFFKELDSLTDNTAYKLTEYSRWLATLQRRLAAWLGFRPGLLLFEKQFPENRAKPSETSQSSLIAINHSFFPNQTWDSYINTSPQHTNVLLDPFSLELTN